MMATAEYIYTMRDGKNRGTTAGTKYDAELTPFSANVDGGKSASFAYIPSSRIDNRYGRARCPVAAGTAGDPTAGFKFGPGFRQWWLDTMAANKIVRVSIAIQNDYTTHSGSSSGHQAPVIQSGHASGQILFRIRYNGATGVIESYLGENNGGTPTDPIPQYAIQGFTTTDADVATKNGNYTEWEIQWVPNDASLTAVGTKHNMYLTVRTVSSTGSSVFAITQHAHYVTVGAALPRMLVSDLDITLGRTIDTAGTPGGMIGDYLAVVAQAGTDSTPTTNTTTIGNRLTALWSSLDLIDRDGFIRNRGRSRGRA